MIRKLWQRIVEWHRKHGIAHMGLFKVDPRNPARRYCKLCDQQQDSYSYTWASPGWWEDICPVMDASCVCHKFSEHDR